MLYLLLIGLAGHEVEVVDKVCLIVRYSTALRELAPMSGSIDDQTKWSEVLWCLLALLRRLMCW